MTPHDKKSTGRTVDCQNVDQDFIALYIADRLTPREAELFEEHYLGCKRCFAALELTHAAALGVVKTHASEARTRAAWRPSATQWVLVSAAIVIAAIALAFWRPAQPAEQVARVLAPAPPQPAESPRPGPDPAILNQIMPLTAPPAPPTAIRSLEANAARLQFQDGMQSYAAGNYNEAIERFSEATRLDPQHSPTIFYLGVSYLMSDRPDASIEQLSKLTSANSPYAEDSHWYLAAAYLKREDALRARQELNAVIALNDVRSKDARQALERLQASGF